MRFSQKSDSHPFPERSAEELITDAYSVLVETVAMLERMPMDESRMNLQGAICFAGIKLEKAMEKLGIAIPDLPQA